MQWKELRHGGKTYDLSHLRPYTAIFQRPANGTRTAEAFSVNISFSHHCFTEGLPPNDESHDATLRFDVSGDRRIFHVRRWELSKNLPDILATLPRRKCVQTGHSNFFTVALVAEDGATVEYEVFFRVWKPGKGRLNFHVESAYVREAGYGRSRPRGTAIGFFVILHNRRHDRPIHG